MLVIVTDTKARACAKVRVSVRVSVRVEVRVGVVRVSVMYIAIIYCYYKINLIRVHISTGGVLKYIFFKINFNQDMISPYR